ncbi:ABC transporter ATP-binding protein [Isoptericola haloaureus]|uniref:ABC transporter ATP-binding protein n=1 Tax=Isoptericola haloaureus TaxID=1542902 RepID=A0ABU7Z9F1_9MICO
MTAPEVPPVEPVVALRGVSKSYATGAGDLTVLRDVDLTIRDGERVAIVGPSGSGKSTMLGIMGTLDAPSAGDVVLRGRSTATMGDAERSDLRSRTLGFVFQQFHLLPHADAVENVALGMLYSGFVRAERRRRAVEALRRVGLGGRLDHRPTQLSGGEQQRVAVARAIAHEPALLLADEPTGALDEATGESIIDLLCRLDGVSVVVITHDPAVAARFPRQVRIRDGRIVADGVGPVASDGEGR